MNAYRKPSIRDEGLESYLDKNAEKHNDFGYIEFVKMIESRVNVANLARAFNVSPPTIANWIAILKEGTND